MLFQPGAVLGHYEIVAFIGRGGMGEVYKARDTRLGRAVAIKVIAPEVADRADVQRRFEQECRLTAKLDHPRICAVHDIGRQDGVLYLVMEFLEGESLASKTARGPLPRAEAVGYGIEIAAAVNYAHRRGVVHRDLKPANVFITPTGVKVLDFGLAKLRQADLPPTFGDAGGNTAPAPPATLAPRTAEVSLVGTLKYFSPERLGGKSADERSDVFAFGSILYEMFTGARPFEAATPAAVIAAILKADPAPLPPGPGTADLEWVVGRCLAKSPDDRWQSFGDIEATLKWVARTSTRPGLQSTDRARRSWVRIAIAGCLLFAGALAAVGLLSLKEQTRLLPPLLALTIHPPVGGAFTATEGSVESPQLAVSPDGREVAFIASSGDGEPQIWIRALDDVVGKPLPGTEGATYPFWSPTGRKLGFFEGGYLKVIDRRGGPAQPLAEAQNGRGGSWNGDGVIIYAPNAGAALRRIGEDGTGDAELTTLGRDAGETGHRFPQFLPDKRRFIYFVRSSDAARQGIYLGSVDSSERAFLVKSRTSAQHAAPGRLLYVAEGDLLVRRLDERAARLEGEPLLVMKDVATSSNFYSAFSVSGGTLAYGQADPESDELVWLDRKGQPLSRLGGRSRYVDFALAPGGASLAIAEIGRDSDNSDIDLLDVGRGTRYGLTTSADTDASPVWKPDGTHVVFRSNRDGHHHDLYTRPATGAGADVQIRKSEAGKYPTDWTRSGRIVYHTNHPRTRWDIYGATGGAAGPTESLVDSEFNEVQGQVSPDERWLAYTSDRSGRPEIYVMSMQNRGLKRAISTPSFPASDWRGASDPRWRSDGVAQELFYITASGDVMAVPIAIRDGMPAPGQRQRLFHITPETIGQPYTSVYNVAADGSSFLVRVRRKDPRTLPLTVLVNWSPP